MPKKLRKDKDTEGGRGTGEEATVTSGSTPQRAERKNNKKRPQPSESQGSDTDASRSSSESDPESEDDSKKAKKQKKQKKEKRKKDKRDKKDKKEKKLKKEHTSIGNTDASQDAATNMSLPTPPPTSSASSSIQSPTPSSSVSTPLVAAVGSMTVTPSLPHVTIKAPAMLPRTVLASRMVPRQISRPTPQSSTLRPGTSVLSSQPGSIPNVFRAKDIIANHQSHKDITPSSTSTSTAPFTSKEISTPTITPAMLKQAEPIVHFPAGNKKQGKHGEFLYGNYPHYYVKRASEQKRDWRAKSKDDEQVEEESESQSNNKNTTSTTTRRRIYPQVKIAVKTATTPSVLLPSTGYKHTYTRQGQGATSVQDLARQVDLRLEFLEPSWFYNKRVLDIGCNAALLTVFIALHYQPRKIQGVDIDPSLIRKAQQFVRNTFSQLSSEAYIQKKKAEATSSSSTSTSENTPGPVPYEAYYPKSMSYLHGLMPVPPKTQDTETLFPHNIEFRIMDWMSPPENSSSHVLEDEDEAWDVIIGFSLTKWIHLHHGDKGLQAFFHKVYKSLAPGGIFLVEPQAYNTYAKRSKITPTMRENYLAIKMKPEMFEEYLLKTVGFKESKLLGQSEGAATNFNRDIYMFRK